LAVFTSAVLIQSASGQGKDGDKTVDEKAIKALLATYEETWNKHHMKAWGKLITDDVDYVNRAGGLWKGNQKMTWAVAVEKISFLTPDIALVHATWKWPGFTRPSGDEVKDFRGIISAVMVTRWQVADPVVSQHCGRRVTVTETAG
jgi:uncharacterized protein (TIGR02246 family)